MKKTYFKPEIQVVDLNRLQPLMITSLPKDDGTVSYDDVLTPEFSSDLLDLGPLMDLQQ